jgi:DNA-binding NtrC family response regulator
MTEARILVVDDQRHVLTALDLLLSREFSAVKCIQKPGQILSEVKAGAFDSVLLDMNYTAGQHTGNEGLFWLRELMKLDRDLSVVMITAFGDIELAVTALKEGAVDFVLKPWDNQKLLATMRTAVRLCSSRRQVKALEKDKASLQAELKGKPVPLIGRSGAMRKVTEMVGKVAATQANVLITGENGTGKELIARRVHEQSGRSSGVMVTVDLGAVPETLFESELFGHVKGAFTDAHADRTGKIETAHRGTLFFDEIGNLSLSLQARLLNVLQNRTITRLGSTESVPVDIRLICATNMNLEEMVKQGDFRMDLLYRINTIVVNLPPLRERGEDVLLLAEYFLRLFAKRYNKPYLKMDDSAEEALKSWSWPGNVRELRHSMERAVILAGDTRITRDSFQFTDAAASRAVSFDGSLDEVEARAISYALRKNDGNLSAAAQQLEISRQTLYNKIKKYGL